MRAFPFVIALLGFIVIAPALQTGWYADDAFYWALPGTLAARHESLLAAIEHAIVLWLVGNARFYPGLVVEKYLVFATFTNLLAYKAFLIATTLVTLELFRRCVARYTSLATGNLAALAACAILQERAYHDAILAYNAMPQFVAIAMLLSLLAFADVLDRGRLGARALALGCFVLAAITYEEVYAFGLLYLALAKARGRTWVAALRASSPFLGISVLLILLAAALHVAFPVHSLYALSFAPLPVLRTGLEQIAAAFPLVYWAADPNGIFGRVNLEDFLRNAPLDPLVGATFAVAAWLALRQVAGERIRLAPLCTIGALIVVLPAFPVALLAKYQDELRPGLGYLPVFVEYFGVALLIVAGMLALRRLRARRTATLVCALAVGLVAAMTQATNVHVARALAPERDAQLALQQALQHGLLRGIPDGATVTFQPPVGWIADDGEGPDGISSSGLFYAYAHARVRLLPQSADADVVLSYDPAARTWRAQRWTSR
ncbi:MAG: hypothetical protein ABSD03_12300 [Vulcanimicrobiaceae bacterium]